MTKLDLIERLSVLDKAIAQTNANLNHMIGGRGEVNRLLIEMEKQDFEKSLSSPTQDIFIPEEK